MDLGVYCVVTLTLEGIIAYRAPYNPIGTVHSFPPTSWTNNKPTNRLFTFADICR